jgi:hypothetical protein
MGGIMLMQRREPKPNTPKPKPPKPVQNRNQRWHRTESFLQMARDVHVVKISRRVDLTQLGARCGCETLLR